MRRVLAIVVLTGASILFLFRFQAPPSGVVHADDLVPVATVLPGSTTTTTHPPSRTRGPDDVAVLSIDVDEWWGQRRVEVTVINGAVVSVDSRQALPGQEMVSGPAVQTGWGRVRVEVTVADGTMEWISMMLIPADTQRSRVVSRETEPILRDEALATQSADLHVVSGATQFSLGYMRALRGAMEAAGL